MDLKITKEVRSLLKKALGEDLGPGDITTRTLIPKNQKGEAVIVAKESGVFCGGKLVQEIFRLQDPALKVKLHVAEGSRVQKGKRTVTIRGRVPPILEAERVALNFLGHLSGVSTLTRAFVEKTKGTHAKIFDTRKTTPLWRELEKYAVRCGGGENHRFGLWDEILVKDNHWKAIWAILDQTKCRYFGQRLRPLLKRRKIPVEVEVRSLKELAHLLEGTFVPDRVLLDNFSIPALKRSVLFVRGVNFVLRKHYRIHRKLPLLEASGGVTLENVHRIAQTGVDRISVGSLTHSAPALDFSLKLAEVVYR